MNEEANALIEHLKLEPLPEEGGFFRRTWTSPSQLPDGRSAGSAILFLLTNTAFSALHRLQTDEVWLFHGGDAIEHVQLIPEKTSPVIVRIGPRILEGDTSQLVVRGGNWQGARLLLRSHNGEHTGNNRGWSLMSCVMAPAWEDRQFVLGDRAMLLDEFPQAQEQIRALTR